MVLSEKSKAELQEIGESYLIICMNVAEKPLELTPKSLSIGVNKWEVYDPNIEGIKTGIKCSGLSFNCLEEGEREVLASFCKLGHGLELVRAYNPQTFAHLKCPREPPADANSPHGLYPYTVEQVQQVQASQPDTGILNRIIGNLEFARSMTGNIRAKMTMEALQEKAMDEERIKSDNTLRPFSLPSLKKYYEQIHWYLFG
jgi:hypothetical protein